jgi:hypothetical protein
MSIEGQKFYPGEDAEPGELLRLAVEYRRAAKLLLENGRRRDPLSFSPYRFVVIQSVELYLDAFLRTQGHPPTSLRGMPHNFAVRTILAIEGGLKLRHGTAAHLRLITETREYLVARYDPDPKDKLSELTRLRATLDDVAKKVEAVVNRKQH